MLAGTLFAGVVGLVVTWAKATLATEARKKKKTPIFMIANVDMKHTDPASVLQKFICCRMRETLYNRILGVRHRYFGTTLPTYTQDLDSD